MPNIWSKFFNYTYYESILSSDIVTVRTIVGLDEHAERLQSSRVFQYVVTLQIPEFHTTGGVGGYYDVQNIQTISLIRLADRARGCEI